MSWISYNDGEVASFHPICEIALKEALANINKDADYSVVHHLRVNKLQLDFAIINNTTKKIICIIEVKRTRAAVESSRFQFQAMSYIQEANEKIERPYYIVTNLETCALFYYSKDRPTPQFQLQAPGISFIANFTEKQTTFTEKLIKYFSNTLITIFNNRINYHHALSEFIDFYNTIDKHDRSSCLIPCLYEYIRGVFDCENLHIFPDINHFKNKKNCFNLQRLWNKTASVDFDAIFKSDIKESNLQIPQKILSELYQYAKNDYSGYTISNFLYDDISSGKESQGEISTDPELARIVAILANKTLNKPLTATDKVCDPAAGSGVLLLETAKELRIKAGQLLANDIKSEYAEILSLKLGLNYVHTLQTPNNPTITTFDIADLPKQYYEDVKLLVLNPPYLSAANDTSRKNKLYEHMRAEDIEPQTDIGQMPLEAAFIEFLLHRLPDGVTVALIIPERHLTALGKEAITLRDLLLNKLGLTTIFTYPCEGVFNKVTISTCVLIGKTNTKNDKIDVYRSLVNIEDINISLLKEENLSEGSDFEPIFSGMEHCKLPREDLQNSLKEGWKNLSTADREAAIFIKKIKDAGNLKPFKSSYTLKRGKLGNSGGSNLLFLKKEAYKNYPENIFAESIRNSSHLSLIFQADSKLPIYSKIWNEYNHLINQMINDAAKDFQALDSKQKKKHKTTEQLATLLRNSEKLVSSGHNILIPRASRVQGGVIISDKDIYVSTNFFICNLKTKDEARLLGSWMSTIYYQLNCFLVSNNQEGMRKLEKISLEKTLIPDLNALNKEAKHRILQIADSIQPLDFYNPSIQPIDEVWSEILFGKQSNNILNEAIENLHLMLSIR